MPGTGIRIEGLRPLLALSLLFAALLAGCQYWENLAGEPKPAKAPFSGRVVDAYSKRPVGGAAVEVAGLSTVSDADGYFRLDQVPTGRRRLSLSGTSYVSESFEVAIGKEGESGRTLALVRNPASFFAGREPPRLRVLGALRAPGLVTLGPSQPLDSNFRFAYSSTGGAVERSPDALPEYSFFVPRPLSDTAILKVYYQAEGRSYLAAEDRLPLLVAANRKPSFSLFANPVQTLTCRDSIALPYKALDPDGECDSVEFRIRQPTSSLFYRNGIGRGRVKGECGEGVALLPLFNPANFLVNPDNRDYRGPAARSETFTIEGRAYDDNKADSILVETVTVRTSRQPEIGIAYPSTLTHYRGEEVRFEFTARGPNGVSIVDIEIDYGDGSDPRTLKVEKDTVVRTELHRFDTAGTFTVVFTARAADCGISRDSVEVTVRRNTPPSISLFFPRGQTLPDSGAGEIEILMRITDPDTESGKDSLTSVLIEFGDGSTLSLRDALREFHTGKTLRHTYTHAASVFPVRVRAFDLRGGLGEKTSEIRRF